MWRLRVGAALLAVWSGLNLVVAAVVTGMILLGQTPPALLMLFSETEVGALDARVTGVVRAVAVLANPCIVALCLLVLMVIWKGLLARATWAFWSLVVVLVPLQMFGFVSDSSLGHQNVVANIVSSTVLLGGLGLSYWGLLTQGN